MNDNLKVSDLLRVLQEREIEAGCRWVLKEDQIGNLGNKVLRQLAEVWHFRLVFLERRTVEENAVLLKKQIKRREFEWLQEYIVRGYLIEHQRVILKGFLDGCGIPNKDGFVEGDDVTATTDQFVRGLDAVLGRYEPRVLGVYLGYLLLCGGDFFVELRRALEVKGIEVRDLLSGKSGKETLLGGDREELKEECRVYSWPGFVGVFTTLDYLLISTAIASAFGEMGALTREQVEDLVEEVTELNSKRQHTLLHRGFVHALFERPYCFHFPGENTIRRLWYFTGVILGLLRAKKEGEVLQLLRKESELTDELCNSLEVRCGAVLLPEVFDLLWKGQEYRLILRWVTRHLDRVPGWQQNDLLNKIYHRTASLVRRGQWGEAEGFLNFMDEYLRVNGDKTDSALQAFLDRLTRKRAQVYQLRGEFETAKRLLRELTEKDELENGGDVWCDLALIDAGFRSLKEVLPEREGLAQTVVAALKKSEALLEEAVQKYPRNSTNAHFCLGLIKILDKGTADLRVAIDHLSWALAGMSEREEAYAEGGLVQWTRFLLGLALLERMEVADFKTAQEYLERALEESGRFPLGLWERVMAAADLFDDKSLGEKVAEHLLRIKGDEAFEPVWRSGLAVSVKSLRQKCMRWLQEGPVSVPARWDRLKDLLKRALMHGELDLAEEILDGMEKIAEQGHSYRQKFLDWLEDDRNYSPAWGWEDVTWCRVKFYELQGQLENAAALLRELFFRLLRGDARSLHDAQDVFNRIIELKGDQNGEYLDNLKRQLEQRLGTTSQQRPHVSEILAERPIRLLFIGGDEHHAAHESWLQSELAKGFKGHKVSVDFIFTGWSSNWGVYYEHVKSRINDWDALVIHKMIRTMLGRKLRSLCDSKRPWFACTGGGRESMLRSIELAVVSLHDWWAKSLH
ncbi:MAG: hypothetical protein NZM04_04115 [Methylacidiphilales bacterium]|nr:hypothetical protein [Candidatus Methylacidiphilales bacterium]